MSAGEAAEVCPHCSVSLRGQQIPEEYLRDGSYGEWNGEQRFYSRKVGVEVQGVYDGVLFWQCPDCDGRWHRWSERHPLRRTASLYVELGHGVRGVA